MFLLDVPLILAFLLISDASLEGATQAAVAVAQANATAAAAAARAANTASADSAGG